MTGVSEAVRISVRKTVADMKEARETPPERFGGHRGIYLANLEGHLGQFTEQLLDEVERLERALRDADVVNSLDIDKLYKDIALALYVDEPSGLIGEQRGCTVCGSGSAAHYCPPREEAKVRLRDQVREILDMPPRTEKEAFADFYDLDPATLPELP